MSDTIHLYIPTPRIIVTSKYVSQTMIPVGATIVLETALTETVRSMRRRDTVAHPIIGYDRINKVKYVYHELSRLEVYAAFLISDRFTCDGRTVPPIAYTNQKDVVPFWEYLKTFKYRLQDRLRIDTRWHSTFDRVLYAVDLIAAEPKE